MIDAATRQRIEDTLGHQFANPQLLEEAFTHASSADDRLRSNERMEFLGDAVLGYVVCAYLFREFEELLEGELTKIKSAVVSRQTCARISRQLDLGPMLSMGKGMSGRPSLPPSVWAAVLEAVIAAIYLDGGVEAAERFILKHMRPVIDEMAESSHQHNFKSVLQHYAQKQLPDAPSYILLDEKGPDHAKCFEVCVEINGERFSSAWARTKKQAEQEAALLALRDMGLVEVNNGGTVVLCEPLAAEQ